MTVSPLARNGYSYAPSIAKSKAACGLCLDQLGGHVELPWLIRMYDVIHKTGSTKRIASRQKKNRATAIDNVQKKIGKDRTSISVDMLADRQTHTDTCIQTDRQTDWSIALLCFLIEAE